MLYLVVEHKPYLVFPIKLQVLSVFTVCRTTITFLYLSYMFMLLSHIQTSDFTLYENVPGHPTRFELRRKKESLIFQAETVQEKTHWTQDVWDLYFSHMLQLKGTI